MLRGWIPILTKGIEITFFAIIGRPIGKDIKKQTKKTNKTKIIYKMQKSLCTFQMYCLKSLI